MKIGDHVMLAVCCGSAMVRLAHSMVGAQTLWMLILFLFASGNKAN